MLLLPNGWMCSGIRKILFAAICDNNEQFLTPPPYTVYHNTVRRSQIALEWVLKVIISPIPSQYSLSPRSDGFYCNCTKEAEYILVGGVDESVNTPMPFINLVNIILNPEKVNSNKLLAIPTPRSLFLGKVPILVCPTTNKIRYAS